MTRCICCHLVKDLDSKGRCAHEGKRQLAHLAHTAGKPVKICPVCGKEVSNDSRRRYCSFECYEKHQLQYNRNRMTKKKKGNGK